MNNDKWGKTGGKSADNMKWALWLWRMARALSCAPPLAQIAVVAGLLYVLFLLLGFVSRLLFWVLMLALLAIGVKVLWDALTKGKPK